MTDYLLWLIPLAFLTDLWIGDPVYRFHPIRIIGNHIITPAEKWIRDMGGDGKKGGLVLILVTLTLAVGPVIWINHLIKDDRAIYYVFNGFILYSCIAVKDLKSHVLRVNQALVHKNIDQARYCLSFIVGRQTRQLDQSQVAQACVETMAENLSDGIIAPLFFACIGGAPLALLYKAANTMDSMVGYQNERYFYFGYYPARLDDVLNWIPARITLVLMLAAGSWFTPDWKTAVKVAYADRRKHKSPNSAYPEAAIAGVMNVRLGGPNYYHDQLVQKPYINQAGDPVNIAHIKPAWQITFLTSVLALVCFEIVRIFVYQYCLSVI